MIHKILIPSFIITFFLASCSNNDPKEEVCINSKYIVEMWFGNHFMNHPSISNLIEGRSDEEFLENYLKMAATIDSLQMIYIHESGGFYPEGGIAKPNMKGDEGFRIYQEYQLPQKLDSLLSDSQLDSTNAGRKLFNSVSMVIKENITKNSASLKSKDYLSSTPFSIISLELSLIENQIHTLLIKHISENK